MAKRYIGIDWDRNELRLACLSSEGGGEQLTLSRHRYASVEEARAALAEGLGSPALGDRVVTALPASAGYVRRLSFPFKEKSKLAATVPLELAASLPVGLERGSVSFSFPREDEGGYQVDAALVDNAQIEALLECFPEPEQSPRRIDLLPHALLAGLGDAQGLLVYGSSRELVVALADGEQLVDYRLLPRSGDDASLVAQFVLSQAEQLENRAGLTALPLWPAGAGLGEELRETWRQAGRRLEVPPLPLAEAEIDHADLPAVLLALGESRKVRSSGFNFRSGPYALRGQLERLKKRLLAAGVLALLTLGLLVASSWLEYRTRAAQAERLQQELTTRFRQILPNSSIIVDVPLQLESHARELQEQARLLGVGGRSTVLAALETLSQSIGPALKLDLREFNYSGEQIRLDGYTDSFETVNRITQALGRSPLFSAVSIDDAKLALDGSRVDFKLQLSLQGEGGQP